MKFLAMIQARCGSTRLPNKIFKDLCGRTVLERVLDRVSQSKRIDEVMVVTTLNKEDIKVVELVASMGVRVFAGSSEDVLDRYYQAAKLLSPKYIVRITADCPLFDYEILDEAIDALSENTDYLGFLSDSFADGLDLEIVGYSSLQKAWKKSRKASEREHVTPYIRYNPKIFQIQDFPCKYGDLKDKRWTIDEPEDYEFVYKIFEHFNSIGKETFLTQDVLEFLQENPELEKINQGFIRNEGYLKSLNNDYIMNQETE